MLSMLKSIYQNFFKQREPHPLLIENKQFFKKFDQSGDINRYEFTVFDTELTGLSFKEDEIISIGAVKIRGLKIIAGENFCSYIKNKRPPSKISTLIHKITPDILKNAPSIENVLPEFISFIGHSFLVGHYIGLDVKFLNKALRRYMGGTINNPCIDTMKLAQVLKEEEWGNYYDRFNYKISYNLDDLSNEYGLPDFISHDALEDAYQTAYLFLYLIKRLRYGGLSTMKELYMAGKSWRWIF